MDKDSKSPDIPARRASGQPLCLPLGFHLGRIIGRPLVLPLLGPSRSVELRRGDEGVDFMDLTTTSSSEGTHFCDHNDNAMLDAALREYLAVEVYSRRS